jgi:hypothetical protein
VTALGLALNRVPEERRLLFQMLDQAALADLVLDRAGDYFLGRPSSIPVGR